MVQKVQKENVACVEVPMWEVAQGPHYDDLQRLLEAFWIPDMTSTEQLLLQFDLIIIPDPVLAKYMVEAYYEKEAKVEKKRTYYQKLQKQVRLLSLSMNYLDVLFHYSIILLFYSFNDTLLILFVVVGVDWCISSKRKTWVGANQSSIKSQVGA